MLDSVNVTLRQVIHFALSHPLREQVWPGWADTQVMDYCYNAVRDDEAYCVISADERTMIGLIVAEIDHAHSDIKISCILTSNPHALLKFVRRWMELYPTYTASGTRNGVHRSFPIKRFSHFLRTSNELRQPISATLPA